MTRKQSGVEGRTGKCLWPVPVAHTSRNVILKEGNNFRSNGCLFLRWFCSEKFLAHTFLSRRGQTVGRVLCHCASAAIRNPMPPL
jgi:hypothetical protein